jgi:hypothetical protein
MSYLLVKAIPGQLGLANLQLGDFVATIKLNDALPFGTIDDLPYYYRIMCDETQEQLGLLFEAPFVPDGEVATSPIIRVRYLDYALLSQTYLDDMAAGLTVVIPWSELSLALVERA